MGPVPLPGHPLGFGHVHALLPVPSVVGSAGDRGRVVDSRLHPPDGARARDRAEDPLSPPRRRGEVVLGRRALDRRRRAPRHRRDGPPELRLPVHVHRLLPLRPGLHTGVPRPRALRRRDRSSAVLDRRRRPPRQARDRDRQRRDSGDAHPGAGAGRRPRDDAAALAELRHLAARGRSDRGPARARTADPARLSDRALEERPARTRDLRSEPTPAGGDETPHPLAARAPAPARLRHRHALQSPL